MPDFYLIGDESIVLTSQNVILEKELYEAILTTRRLILIRAEGGKDLSREILLREVGSAIAGETGPGEPTITLTFTTPDGVLHAQELVFPKKTGGQDSLHYAEWVKRLKEQVKIAALEPVPATADGIMPEHETVAAAYEAIGTAGERVPAEEEWIATAGETNISGGPVSSQPGGTPLIIPSVFPTPEPIKTEALPSTPKAGRHTLLVTILIIAIVIIGGAYYYTHHRGQPLTGPVPTVIALQTAMPTATPAPATTLPSIVVTTPVPVTPPPVMAGGEVIVPSTGIWVRVQYPGNFSGSVGIQGSMRDIAGSGDRFFQIPAIGGIIDASIQKQDNSGRVLVVTFYENGTTVKQGNTTAPHGTLVINAWV